MTMCSSVRSEVNDVGTFLLKRICTLVPVEKMSNAEKYIDTMNENLKKTIK